MKTTKKEVKDVKKVKEVKYVKKDVKKDVKKIKEVKDVKKVKEVKDVKEIKKESRPKMLARKILEMGDTVTIEKLKNDIELVNYYNGHIKWIENDYKVFCEKKLKK